MSHSLLFKVCAQPSKQDTTVTWSPGQFYHVHTHNNWETFFMNNTGSVCDKIRWSWFGWFLTRTRLSIFFFSSFTEVSLFCWSVMVQSRASGCLNPWRCSVSHLMSWQWLQQETGAPCGRVSFYRPSGRVRSTWPDDRTPVRDERR